MMPTAMDHNMSILDEAITHYLSVPRDDNTSSVLNQHAFHINLQKHNHGELFQYSKQAVGFLFGFIWMTIGCLAYILQHSPCMDPGELSWLPESGIFSEPSTHLIFLDSGGTNPLFAVRETQNKFTISLMSRDI